MSSAEVSRPLTAKLAWSLLGQLRDLDRSVAMDLILASVYLLAGESRERLVGLATSNDHSAVGEMIAAAWDEDSMAPGWANSMRRTDRVGHRLQLAAARIVLGLAETVPREQVMDDNGSPAEAFDMLLALPEDGKHTSALPTPPTVVHAMADMLAPRPDESIYDPSCRVGELLIGAAEAVLRRTGKPLGARIAGQALDSHSRSISTMNLAVHGIKADLGRYGANTLHDDLHAGSRFDVVFSNPPFNQSWNPDHIDRDRLSYAVPPAHNANFAWLQLSLSKLNTSGRLGILLPNNAGVSENPAERAVRVGLLRDGLVDCMVALPPQLFPGTAIPVTMWILDRERDDRDGKVLFIDATRAGVMAQRTRRELESSDVDRMTGAYHAWRNREEMPYQGAATVPVKQILARDANLNPRAYVDAPDAETRPPTERSLAEAHQEELHRLSRRAAELDDEIDRKLAGLRWRR